MTRRSDRWIFASGNTGKFAELQALLAPTGIVLASRSEFGLESPEETGQSFLENALIKARHAAAATGFRQSQTTPVWPWTPWTARLGYGRRVLPTVAHARISPSCLN